MTGSAKSSFGSGGDVGWHARIEVLVPPGNPTVEPGFYLMTPERMTIHLAPMQGFQTTSAPGAAAGTDIRTLAYLDELSGPAKALESVSPSAVIPGHTASSYATGFADEPQPIDCLSSLCGTTSRTAARAARTALQHLGVKKLALGTPFPETISTKGKDFWEAAGFDIVGYHRLVDVQNIYSENEQRAYELARRANTPRLMQSFSAVRDSRLSGYWTLSNRISRSRSLAVIRRHYGKHCASRA